MYRFAARLVDAGEALRLPQIVGASEEVVPDAAADVGDAEEDGVEPAVLAQRNHEQPELGARRDLPAILDDVLHRLVGLM